MSHNYPGAVTMSVVLPPPPARIHFVGIGGIGMSGLARILQTRGHVISGSDATASPLTSELAGAGMAVTIGHGAIADAARAGLVVATAAVDAGNPELAAAREAGVPVVKRAALLGLLANDRFGVAIAGSHGKSSTCGMLVTALRALGADPTYAIGAVLAATGTNAAPGNGPHMVVEADEYDYSFLHLTPRLAVITNIEFDHPDLFPDQNAYDAAFARFVAGIDRAGTLVMAADDPGCRRLRARIDFAPPARLLTFGASGAEADWRLSASDEGWRVNGPDGVLVPITLQTPGFHMARNATAALVALAGLGYAPDRAAGAVSGYSGIGRRFELKGEAGGVIVIDDYAHHPSEIRANLAATRERYPRRRLWAVFQPHTFSRLRALLPEFGAAFAAADRVMILDVYAAREVDDLGIGAADLLALLPPDALGASDPAAAADKLASEVRSGDVVLTMGAGTITETGPYLLELLRAAFPAANLGT
ncbi:MAG: UDP-N-acetylmuramate--L-alanine ligase, partial [Chloroflexota bacterium]|nr:UDP-N-acetylmuramate--L-alanine ligase [Chloroflexota bacterium]